ncbi:hypothetical protein JCM11641_006178 [Rhodosporidiobolus odoratus]
MTATAIHLGTDPADTQAAAKSDGAGGAEYLPHQCSQALSLVPRADDTLDAHRQVICSDDYHQQSAQLLGGLVRVKSESFMMMETSEKG